MSDIPTTEPVTIQAGDTLSWSKSLTDYPADNGWTLSYRLINELTKHDISTAASGSDHLVSTLASITASYSPGKYTLLSWVTKGAERYSLPSKQAEVLPNLAIWNGGYDSRSTAKQVLDLLDAAMVSHGKNAWVQEYEIAGRSMKFKSASEFLSYRSKIQAEVNREANTDRLKSGLQLKNKISVRM